MKKEIPMEVKKYIKAANLNPKNILPMSSFLTIVILTIFVVRYNGVLTPLYVILHFIMWFFATYFMVLTFLQQEILFKFDCHISMKNIVLIFFSKKPDIPIGKNQHYLEQWR